MTYREFLKKLLKILLDKEGLLDCQVNIQQLKAILAGKEDKIRPRDFWKELSKP